MTERWLPVPGHEGLYEVSDRGRVRSLGRYVQLGHPGSKPRWQHERILRPGVTRGTYRTVRLSRNSIGKTFILHRLVLETFVGPAPDGTECCHNNGDASDNRLANLRWDTAKANMADQLAHGTHWSARKTHCKHGHEFTSGNTYHFINQAGNPRRMCKACCLNRGRERRANRKELSA